MPLGSVAKTRGNVAAAGLRPIHTVIIVVFLAVSAISGRQLFVDGTNYVVQSLLDPGWFPQPTPRRFFAFMWTTGAVRLLGLVDDTQVRLASLLFGSFAFAVIAAPIHVIVKSPLENRTRYAILTLFLSATVFLANFVVTELLFALSLTTIFVVYMLDPRSDPKSMRRMVIAFLLIASYEVVALSNVFLLAGYWIHSGREVLSYRVRLGVASLLCLAPPFQIGWYLHNSQPGAGDAFDVFVYAIAAVFALAIVSAYLLLLLLRRLGINAYALVLLAFALPVALLLVPESVWLRTRAFQYAYPSRIYSMLIVLALSALPIAVGVGASRLPARLMSFFQEKALLDLCRVGIGFFCGVSLLASLDAYRYRTGLENGLASKEGVIGLAECDFCAFPEKYGSPDLSYDWIWPVYGMAATMSRGDDRSVVVVGRKGVIADVRGALALFLAQQRERRQRGSSERRTPAGKASAAPLADEV